MTLKQPLSEGQYDMVEVNGVRKGKIGSLASRQAIELVHLSFSCIICTS